MIPSRKTRIREPKSARYSDLDNDDICKPVQPRIEEGTRESGVLGGGRKESHHVSFLECRGGGCPV